MTEKLKVGVIGVGYLGKFHAKIYAGLDNVELVGVVDAKPSECTKNCRSIMAVKSFLAHQN